MVLIWDYDEKELRKTKEGKRLILERMINNGIYLKDKEKISLRAVKENWNKLRLEPRRKKFLQFLIWEK